MTCLGAGRSKQWAHPCPFGCEAAFSGWTGRCAGSRFVDGANAAAATLDTRPKTKIKITKDKRQKEDFKRAGATGPINSHNSHMDRKCLVHQATRWRYLCESMLAHVILSSGYVGRATLCDSSAVAKVLCCTGQVHHASHITRSPFLLFGVGGCPPTHSKKKRKRALGLASRVLCSFPILFTRCATER